MQEQTIANDILFAYAERELRAGRKVRVRLVGYSMMPTLNPATDTLCIAPATSAPRLYDVVLAKVNGQYILHRLIKKTADGWLMRGDGNGNRCEPIQHSAVLGVLTAVSRGGKTKGTAWLRWKTVLMKLHRVKKKLRHAISSLLKQLNK